MFILAAQNFRTLVDKNSLMTPYFNCTYILKYMILSQRSAFILVEDKIVHGFETLIHKRKRFENTI